MDRELLRVELLKLTYSHGRSAGEAVSRAKELENYVYELGQTKPELTPVSGKSTPKVLTSAENDIFR